MPFVMCAGYWIFAFQSYWIPATGCLVILSFLTYGSISHDLVHRTLGLPGWVNQWLLSIIELLAIRSGHAYRAVHLHHHRRYPHDDDIEAMAAKMTFFGAILEGFVFVPRISIWALKHAESKRSWIIAECSLAILFIVTSVVMIPISVVPLGYVALMIAGSWIIPVITSYIPHHPTGDTEIQQTRVFRGLLFRIIAIDHLYHLEHHLYPAVPHYNWHKLATRIDPWLEENGVEPIRARI